MNRKEVDLRFGFKLSQVVRITARVMTVVMICVCTSGCLIYATRGLVLQLHGNVTDESTGKPLPDASISASLRSKKPNFVSVATTLSDGTFSGEFNWKWDERRFYVGSQCLNPERDILVRISKDGYSTREYKFDLENVVVRHRMYGSVDLGQIPLRPGVPGTEIERENWEPHRYSAVMAQPNGTQQRMNTDELR